VTVPQSDAERATVSRRGPNALDFSDRIEVGDIIGRGAQRVPFGKHLGYFLDLSLLHR
jgi:hypothetical protein